MASINPIPSYMCDPAEAMFRRALRHIRPAIIHDFLSLPEITHAQKVKQMLLQPRRITVNMSFNTVIPSSDAPSLNESMRCLIFPTFSMDSLSLTYHVSEHVTSSISLHKSPYIARCLLNDQHNMFVKLSDLDTGLTEICVIMLHSPGFREVVFMVVATAPFRAVMESLENGRDCNDRMMQNALIYTCRTYEIRPCPSCGNSSVACACDLELLPKRQPMDFDTDLANLMKYMGSYEGECYQAFYEGGVKLSSWVSNVARNANVSHDAEGCQQLESWVFWDTLHGNENLHRLTMPDVDTDAPATEHGVWRDREPGDSADAIARGSHVLARSTFVGESGIDIVSDMEAGQFLSDRDARGLVHEFPDLETIDDAPVPLHHSVCSHVVTMPVPEHLSFRSSAATRPVLHETRDCDRSTAFKSSCGSPRGLEYAATGCAPVPQHHSVRSNAETMPVLHGARVCDQPTVLRECGVSSHTQVPTAEVHNNTQSTGRTGQPQVPKQPHIVIPPSVGPVPQPQTAYASGQMSTAPKKYHVARPKKRIGRPPAPKARGVTKIVPILPAPEPSAAETPATETTATKTTAAKTTAAKTTGTVQADIGNAINDSSDEDRRRKLELRKAPNRESAIRSNERKKKQVQALQDNLEEAKKQEAALRQKEQDLKEANAALREELER